MAKTTPAAQATAPEAAAPAADKAQSKMQRAKALYDEVFSAGYDLGGKSQRQVFKARAIAEIGMTDAGANTYFQNISNEKAGKGLYKYNKTEKKPGAEAPANTEGNMPGTSNKAPTKAQVAAAQADLTKRWQVQNPKGKLVNSFGTKKAAEEYAEAGPKGMKVIDSKAS